MTDPWAKALTFKITEPLAEASGNDSKQWQRFKTEGLSDLEPMRNGGVPIFSVSI
jgi:hypothetical protein